MIRVLLADHHGVVRAGLKALIGARADMQVVGEAADGAGAVRLAAELRPDVAVLDLSMAQFDDVLTAGRIRQVCPGVQVVVLTAEANGEYVRELVRSGVSGHVLKQAPAEELIHAIRVVARGGVYLKPPCASEALSALVGHGRAVEQGPRAALSGRESEVLRLIAAGYSNKEVAARLKVSVKTVETHKSRSMDKLGFHSRVDLLRYAVHHGWLQDV